MLKFKTVIIILLVAAVIIALLYFGFGMGFGSGTGTGNSKEVSTQEQTDDIEEEETVIESETSEDSEIESTILSVTISGNDYYYKNNRIELEELIKVASQIEGRKVVKIKEDKASLKAYNELVEALEAARLIYEEE